MIDHIIIEVSDFTASKKFYREALSPLGTLHRIVCEEPLRGLLGVVARGEGLGGSLARHVGTGRTSAATSRRPNHET